MSEPKARGNQCELLESLRVISQSDEMKTGGLKELKTVYAKINLIYIDRCEKCGELSYMPSAKYDEEFKKYFKTGNVKKVRTVVTHRLNDLVTYVERM